MHACVCVCVRERDSYRIKEFVTFTVNYRTQSREKSRYFERSSENQSRGTHKTLHYCRGRERMKASEEINDGANTLAAGQTEAMRMDDISASISMLDCTDI
ncbi:hypothetical protein EVAR_13196_1 [Eumeta japonica]|uniref:Uncharacterized protein n=1 Tax=Eumeta variegata TaxID=151549 RepID=A0A4C1TS35_EUMVA|nr:hypothetical protein EVAR_13196_1 [Eumeta japonica]